MRISLFEVILVFSSAIISLSFDEEAMAPVEEKVENIEDKKSHGEGEDADFFVVIDDDRVDINSPNSFLILC